MEQNKLTNIVRLCPVCHRSVHWSKHLDDYNKGHLGERKKRPMPEGCKKIVDDYIYCRMGLQECLNQLPVRNKKKTLRDFWRYKDYLEELNISACRNNIDIINKNGVMEDGKKLGYIEYSDDKVLVLYYNMERSSCEIEESK